MTARRLLGLLTMFMMLHLTLVGPDNVCAEHHHGAAPGQMQGSHGEHDMAQVSMSVAASHASSHEPCETPSSNHCCEAVTSCALSFAVAARGGSPNIALQQDAAPSTAVDGLLSRSLGPEPPPPKA